MGQKVLTAQTRAISGNPFYQMAQTLRMFQELPKVDDAAVTKTAVHAYLENAWNECKGNKEKRELFMVIMFSLGDITNREHNLFRKVGLKDVENGGLSKRRTFIFCLEWLLMRAPEQFYTFLPIIGEYYNLDGTMLYELRTDRFKGNLKETLHLDVDIDRVTTYIASILTNSRTTDNEKFLWAKWLPHVPSSHRVRKYTLTEKTVKAFQKNYPDAKLGDTLAVKKDKKSHTETKDGWTKNFIYQLSKKVGWDVIRHKQNTEYKGYRDFKRKFLILTEATMFSTKRILELDKSQFTEWLDKLPSGARFNVQRRLLEQSKTGKVLTSRKRWVNAKGEDFGELFLAWVKSKEVAQQTVRNLTVEQKAEMAPLELKQLQKDAKVNVGAETIMDMVAELLANRHQPGVVDIKAHSFLEKVKILVPVLVCGDISGSMGSASVRHKNFTFTAQAMCQLLVTLFLLKNPDEELKDLFIRFDTDTEVICAGEKATKAGANRYMGQSSTVVPWLTDSKKPFSENLANVSQYVLARGGTGFNTVAIGLKAWVDAEPAFSSQRKEQINKYPVFLVVSDGDMNSHYTPAQSLLDFQSKMRQWFGWEGVVCIWDVKSEDVQTNKFDGLDNVMYFGGCNVGLLNAIFTSIHDLDIIDIYLPLQAMSRSIRYSPVRSLTI